jgi:hypothetical protein
MTHLPPICENVHQVAKSILTHSFAIYRVDSRTRKSLNDAWLASHFFLSLMNESRESNKVVSKKKYNAGTGTDSSDDKSCSYSTTLRNEKEMKRKYQNVHEGNLFGYNRPSSTKLLFRVFYSYPPHQISKMANDDECEYYKKEYQPWPDDTDEGKLKCASNQLSMNLHGILLHCTKEILRHLFHHEKITLQKNTSLITHENITPKRRRISNQKDKEDNDDNDGKCEYDFELPNLSTMLCPLDYFLYHNNNMNDDVIHCSEHIDRGVLICVSLTNVQGLEVFSTASGKWYCPEDLTSRFCENKDIKDDSGDGAQTAECSDLICIMSGDQLSKVMDNFGKGEKQMNDKNSYVKPCLHRVKKKLSRERLSISYELRI